VANDDRPPEPTATDPSEHPDGPDAELDGWRGDDQAIWQPVTGRQAQGFEATGRRHMRHSTFQRKLVRKPRWRHSPPLVRVRPSTRGTDYQAPSGIGSRAARAIKIGLVAGAIVAALGVAVLADAYYQSFRIYQEAREVLPPLAEAADRLAEGTVPPEGQVESVVDAAGRARVRMDDARFTFGLAGLIPYFGRPVRAVQHTVAAGEHEAEAAVVMRDLVQLVLGDSASPPGGRSSPGEGPPLVRRGRIDLKLLESVAPRLEGVVDLVRRADAEIRAIPPIPFMGFLDQQKAEALAASQQAVAMAEDALVGARLLPSLLGANGQRAYLLVLQDGSRLRPTGGTAIAYAVVGAKGGRLTPLPGSVGDLGGPDTLAPAVLPPAISWFLENVPALRSAAGPGDVNLSPDFPASAQAWADLAASAGLRVDGVVALDTVALSYLLEGRSVTVAGSPGGLTGKNVVEVIGASHSLGPVARQAVAAQALAAALAVLSDPDPLVPTVKQLGQGLRERHIQIWSGASEDQRDLDALGWDGGLDGAHGDHLLVAQTNLGANGLDQYGHLEINHEVTVEAAGDVVASSEIRLTNDPPANLPAAVAGEGSSYAAYRALLGLYAPGAAKLGGAEPAKGPPAHPEGGAMVFVRTIRVPAGKARAVRFEYSVPGAIRSTEEGSVYELTVQRQPSINPARLTVRVTLPPGTAVRSAPGWIVDGNVVALDVTLTRDLVTRIVFSA
jgi:hypothetical protein